MKMRIVKGWKVIYGTIDILHRVVKKDLAETVLLEQTSEQNGKANASNVWETAFEGNSKSESPGVLDIFKDQLVAQ